MHPPAPTPPPWGARLRPAAAVLGACGFRYLCVAIMLALSLYGEARPAPHLPDLLLDRIDYSPRWERYNYLLFVVLYFPLNLCFLGIDWRRFVRFSVSSGLIALCRGVTIALTGLGPVRGPDLNAGLSGEALRAAYLQMLVPSSLLSKAPHVYLTKDLFFSGHTALTFLLLLYLWPHRRLRLLALLCHALVVLSVLLGHLHYSIDIIGAYAITFSLFVLREGDLRPLLAPPARPA